MLAVAFALALTPQNGDVKGEEQPPLRAEWRLPASKALSAEEQLASFRLPKGLKVELVAAEPLVVAPVCATFDERGRLWVCEMRTYMRDADGTAEAAPENAVVVLSDRDGDGRMDERAVFLDGLVLPRAVAPTRGGALVLAPPNLLFARDTDGDDVADVVRVMDSGLQGIASPEHAINGLFHALDNWFWCANAPWRYRWNGDQLERGRTAGGGQWGITEDRLGRIYYNDNSNPLRYDSYPSNFAVRNPNLGVAPGMGVRLALGSKPRPSHLTPGVNRGYRGTTLAEGKLNEFTGACAPWIYEGDALPERFRGDAFVCEPCANLVHHFELSTGADGQPVAESAAPDGVLLESSDERFRPVFLNEGPDGALYVVDMYRGVLQHRLFVTSWLRAQIEERGLEEPIDRGRIWRVTRAGIERKPPPNLADCSWSELGAQLASENRWTRKTAQRLFVEEGEGEFDASNALLSVVTRGAGVARLHALSALDARGAFGVLAVNNELAFSVPRELGSGLVLPSWSRDVFWNQRAAERLRTQPEPRMLLMLGDERSHLALDALAHFAWRYAGDPTARGAMLSCLAGREFDFLGRTLALVGAADPVDGYADTEDALWFEEPPHGPEHVALVESIGACAVNDGRPEVLADLLQWTGSAVVPGAWRVALARGALAARAKDASGAPRPIRLARSPAVNLADAPAEVRQLFDALIWPGKPGSEGLFPRELTEPESARFERGRSIFEQTCAACHQVSGRGDVAIAPPLRNSPWVLGPPERLAKVVYFGLRGPVTLDGLTWDGEMPAYSASDEELASVLTYLRRAWQHGADPVEPELVRAVREANASRRTPWHVSELPAR